MKQAVISVLAFFTLIFSACKSDVTLRLTGTDSLNIRFTGEIGAGIEKFLASAGTDLSMLDASELKQSFEYNGFKDVTVRKSESNQIYVNMNLPAENSDIAGKNLIQFSTETMKVSLTPETMKEFYDAADDNLTAFLDLFMAPVFNDDAITEQEYIELLASVFGEDFAREIENGSLKIILQNKAGKTITRIIPYSKIFTLNEEIILQL